MKEYIICFATSTAIIWCIGSKKAKNPKFIIGSAIALLLPCLLAAWRSDTVGTDMAYINITYELAQKADSFLTYYNQTYDGGYRIRYVSEYEIGYNLLVYLSAKVIGSKHFLMGIVQLMTILPIYLGLKRVGNRYQLTFGIVVYYLMCYNTSLNMMRQWMAMAVLLYAFKDLLDYNIKRYILYILLAFLFHKSAIIGILFVLLRIFLDEKVCRICGFRFGISARVKGITLKCIILVVVSSFVFLFPMPIVILLRLIGLEGYSHYFYNQDTHILLSQLVIRTPLLYLFLCCFRQEQKNIKYAVLFVFCLCDVIFSNLVAGAEYMYRVAWWFGGYGIYSYPYLLEIKRNRKVYQILFLLFFMSYWLFYFVYKGSHQTIPYNFFWAT